VDRTASGFFEDLRRFVESCGVRVVLKRMNIEKPGEFDGLSITINPRHDAVAAAFYLAHSFGSIVQWSTEFESAKKVYDDLRDAKESRDREPERFEAALSRYRTFEQSSSDYAVWVLGQAGHPGAIHPYTIFFRADIEAMTIFHRSGKAPEWPRFYAEWKRRVASGEVKIQPFRAKPVPPFRPVRIEQQEVLQERD
jgi:hypothetical protein